MLITSVTVGFRETHGLPDYCNVRPSMSLTAHLSPDDEAGDVLAMLTDQVQAYVHGEIDHAREMAGLPAVYDNEEPRVDVYEEGPRRLDPDFAASRAACRPPGSS